MTRESLLILFIIPDEVSERDCPLSLYVWRRSPEYAKYLKFLVYVYCYSVWCVFLARSFSVIKARSYLVNCLLDSLSVHVSFSFEVSLYYICLIMHVMYLINTRLSHVLYCLISYVLLGQICNLMYCST